MTTSQYTYREKLFSNIVNDTHESHHGDVILLCYVQENTTKGKKL